MKENCFLICEIFESEKVIYNRIIQVCEKFNKISKMKYPKQQSIEPYILISYYANTIKIFILRRMERVTLQKTNKSTKYQEAGFSLSFTSDSCSLAEEFLKARLCAGRPAFLTESEGPAQRDALMNGFLRVEPLNSRVTPRYLEPV